MTYQTEQAWYRSSSILVIALAVLVSCIAVAQTMLDGAIRYLVGGLAVVAILFVVARMGRNARKARGSGD